MTERHSRGARSRAQTSGGGNPAGSRGVREAAFAIILAGCVAAPYNATAPLGPPGDAARGRDVFVSREAGHCVLCHAVPGIAPAGNVGPSLAGVGARLDAAQLRFAVADITRLKPDAAMPAFHRTQGLARVAPAHSGRPILDARQVEDVVAFLASLR
jgi:sulfur-oxidizing protein SoxX